MKMPVHRWLGRAGILCAKVASTTEGALTKSLNHFFNITLFILVLLNFVGFFLFWFVAGGAR